MDFNNITNDALDILDLDSLSENIISDEYRGFFLCKSSVEHYRLLSYLSLSENNITLLDIGTLKGCSALAMSINQTNKVYSFDVGYSFDLNQRPENITFLIDDVTKPEYIQIILDSKYILLDTYHDGSFERIFYNHLKSIGYKGYLLLDDTKLNPEMESFWSDIDLPKKDISSLGHWSGTGVVFFN